ncbi:MAG: hypothetical protein ACYTEQ_00995 [Planctomycetota bacterium]
MIEHICSTGYYQFTINPRKVDNTMMHNNTANVTVQNHVSGE